MEPDMIGDAECEESNNVAIISPEYPSPKDFEPQAPLRADEFDAMFKQYLPPMPNLEVIDQAVSTWNIESWKELEKKDRGPIFECAQQPWRILLFPEGNNIDTVSIYLEQCHKEKSPDDWYACVHFMLVLWNPIDPTHFIHHIANHRFTTEEADWGFTRFVELRKIFNVQTAENRTRPLIEGNSVRLTAYVRIYRDPTGVLWHNFSNYDSKKETGMVGLKNQGATCYLNSLLQSLYFTPAFREAVYQIPTENEPDHRTNSVYALQRLFHQLQKNNTAVSTQELTGAFGWDSKQIFEQQDVQELSRILMEKLEKKMKNTDAENALTKIFVGKMKTYISCINVNYESSRVEDFWDIQLNVIGNKNLDESFVDYISEEIMKDDNKYFAEEHGLQDARKGVIFEFFPPVLHLQLKRFEYDFQRDAMMKINDRYEFPEIWDASPYLAKYVDRSSPWVYQLCGVLVHSGDLNAGHYYAFIRPNKNDGFYKFDDDRVTKSTLKEAIEENFGGNYPVMPAGHAPQRNPYTRTYSTKRSMNAYMLVYIRQSDMDQVLIPDRNLVPPPHLERRFIEEQEILEKTKKALRS